jgi:hypothetical protein
MPRYQVTAPDGRTVTLEGDTPPTDADLEGIFASLPAPKKSPADMFKDVLGRAGSFGTNPTQQDIQAGRDANIPMLTLGAMGAPAMIANPVAAAKGLAMSVAGGAAGGYAGRAVGGGLEAAGAPGGTSKVLGTVGGLAGGFAGPMVGPQALMRLAEVGGGKGGMLTRLLGQAFPEAMGGVEASAATGAADAAAAQTAKAEAQAAKLALEARKVAAHEAQAAAKIKALEEITKARVAAIERRAAGGATRTPRAVSKPSPPAAPPTEGATALQPEPEFIDPSAVKVLPFPPAKGTVKPATNLGGVAKPGPAPTPPDKLEETLQATLDSLKAKKAGAVRGKSPIVDEALTNAEGMHQRDATAGMTERVADERRRLGSQVVARKLGMERGQVQSDAGTILNEALGEVSPVIPADRWKDIVTKMKSLPPEERVAYVARARGVKNMAQIENLRRTLETLGLLLPLGAVAASSGE